MPEPKQSQAKAADRELVVSRVIHAARELVFDAFTDAEHIGDWWGPNGFRTTTYEMDVRPGGVWRFMMHGPDGTDYPNRVEYLEVQRPERLVYDHGSDEDSPSLFRATVTFTALGEGKTEVRLHSVFASAEGLREALEFGAEEGAQQTLARLDAYLANRTGTD